MVTPIRNIVYYENVGVNPVCESINALAFVGSATHKQVFTDLAAHKISSTPHTRRDKTLQAETLGAKTSNDSNRSTFFFGLRSIDSKTQYDKFLQFPTKRLVELTKCAIQLIDFKKSASMGHFGASCRLR